MRYRSLLLFIIIALCALGSTAQTISGRVSDADGPVPSASVIIKGTKMGTATDNDGNYQIGGLKAGRYTIIVSIVGYNSVVQDVSIKDGEQLKKNFSLSRQTNQLNDVNVSAKTKAQQVRESGFAVNAIQTAKLANTTADLNQVLNHTTGVNVREQGGMGSDFNFSLNGLSGKQIRFFLDGIPMESFGSGLTLNNIPVNLAERIEVYKGVVPVELGSDALGGAVNVITDQHTTKFLDASYSYGSFNTHKGALNARYTDEKTGLVFNVSGFHNSSDNNYLMRSNPKYDASIKVIENGAYVEKDVRRFHDAYRSDMGQVEIGVRNKKWADIFSIGFLYNNVYKEIQTGASQNNVRGALYKTGNFYLPSLKYKKSDFLIKGLTASLNASYAMDRYSVFDTSSFVYGWGGIVRAEAIAGEISDVKTIYHYKNNTGIVRANLNYAIDDKQSLNLNYTYTHFSRTATEEIQAVDNNPFDKPNTLAKQVLGLAYQADMLDKKLTTTVFAKYYGLNTMVRRAVFVSTGNYKRTDSSTAAGNYGYGAAARYKLTEHLGVKASYEHAYRLQEAEELLGDGVNVGANLELQPEHSDNINVGAYYSHVTAKSKFSVEAGYFFRNVKDLIFSYPAGKYSTYINVGEARVNGVEAEFGYLYNNLLEFTVNASYQNAVNSQRLDPTTGSANVTYGDRIPNQPWLYGNANIGIGKNDLLGKDTRIQLNWSSHYVGWFYVNWESRGSRESKNQVPSQLVHDLVVSYSMKNGKYNISAESYNITNTLAYDNFRLQKPGRSLYLKLRYFIK
jgi:outer membrane cobalamin receptor